MKMMRGGCFVEFEEVLRGCERFVKMCIGKLVLGIEDLRRF